MDLLKEELLRKRRLLAEETGGKKLFRQKIHKREQVTVEAKPITPDLTAVSEDLGNNHEIGLSRPEVIRRLRFLKQPMTLFGEDDAARSDRLEHLLKAGPGLDGDLTEGQTNDFLIREPSNKRQKMGIPVRKNQRAAAEMETIKEDGCLGDEDKIRIFLNKLLSEWKQEVEGMRSREGKKMLEQSVRELQPLLECCRKKSVPDEIRRTLALVVESCNKREYEAATIRYVGLAIGNAPWPIGVTMVGIHERSAREKIFASSVAHIMNDETKRKYLQSFKRLMTFCERRYPARD